MSLSQLYSKKVLQHFRNPKNMGEIKNPDGIGKIGNPVCGDIMWLYIKVGKRKDGKEYLKDIKVKTFGCLPAKENVVLSSGGWKNIDSIERGEKVVNSDGKETGVKKTFFREYRGNILKIVPFLI